MGKTILIVDDDSHIRILLELTLEKLEDQGVELLLAADGQEGLDLALDRSPDLIFLDVKMPHLDGHEVCERIRAAGGKTYVILLTAKGQAVDKERGAEAGADEYITKPFDPDYILERATTVLGLEL